MCIPDSCLTKLKSHNKTQCIIVKVWNSLMMTLRSVSLVLTHLPLPAEHGEMRARRAVCLQPINSKLTCKTWGMGKLCACLR